MIRPVTDEASHRKALRRIEQLWSAPAGSPEALELDALATLVDAYERRAFPIPPPDPVDAIEVRCEQLGWSRKELEPLIGSRARVSEVLTRRRALTLPMIRRLHASMGIPADVLIADAGAPSGKRADRPTSPPKALGRSRSRSNELAPRKRRTSRPAAAKPTDGSVAAGGRRRARSARSGDRS